MNTRILFSKSNLSWISLILALAMTFAAVLLHLYSLSVVGGIWRDEVGLVNISLLPTWKEVFWGLMHDHCPIVFPAVVRAWSALGLAQTDAGLRTLGMLIGLLLLGSFWATAQMAGRGVPLLSLALVALNPVVIRYGDCLRGYALGITFIILAMGLVWRYVEKPVWSRGLLAAAGAVISVQTLYQNAFFLLAICAGAMVVFLRQRQWGKIAGILGIGGVAAISLAPYVKPIHDSQTWWLVSRFSVNLAISLVHLSQLLDNFLGLWVVIVVLAVVFGVSRFFTKPAMDEAEIRQELPLFAVITLVIGSAGFLVFIKMSGLPTQVWYYIPLLCFTMICCDLIFPRVHPITTAAVLVIAAFALVVSPAGYSALHWRQTNGDIMAEVVAKNAAPEDLIIVHPWHYGLTFNYYYHGAAKWTTLPPISDYRYHRYDLIKEKIAVTNVIAPVLAQMEATLRAGHRVWVVGDIANLRGLVWPPDPPVAPNGPLRWLDAPYSDAWGNQMVFFLEHHATKISSFVDESTNSIPINPLEKMSLRAASGWTNSP
jgi:hypothetical protein